MSIIRFICDENQREDIKTGVWTIIHDHYLGTAFPNTNAQFENEGRDVYSERMNSLMESELCQIDDTEDGFSVEFDSTEDAGFSIAETVYGTGMGYSDQGLTFLDPLFDRIVEQFPGVCFEADTLSADEWVYEENHYSYDGTKLTKSEAEGDEWETDDEEEEVGNHFLASAPRVFADINTIDMICQNHMHSLSSEAEETGRIEANLTVMEVKGLDYTVVWTPATGEALAEAVAQGYPASMGATAFMLVYKRYNDGLRTDDLKAIRAVVIQPGNKVGFSEMCKDNILRSAMNALYLGVIGLHHYLVDNDLYDTYASLDSESSAMVATTDDQKLDVKVVSGEDIPEVGRPERSEFDFGFFF